MGSQWGGQSVAVGARGVGTVTSRGIDCLENGRGLARPHRNEGAATELGRRTAPALAGGRRRTRRSRAPLANTRACMWPRGGPPNKSVKTEEKCGRARAIDRVRRRGCAS